MVLAVVEVSFAPHILHIYIHLLLWILQVGVATSLTDLIR